MKLTSAFLPLTVLCGSLQAQIATSPLDSNAQQVTADTADSPNPVIEWNKTLLTIVRTPGAQSPTIHSTRSLAMLHVAMYDAVNQVNVSLSPERTEVLRLDHALNALARHDRFEFLREATLSLQPPLRGAR